MAEPSMACAAWQEDLAGWLVGQILPEREALLLEHLASCNACQQEADALLGVAAVTLAGWPPELEPNRRWRTVLGSDAPGEGSAALAERALGVIRHERRARRIVRAGLLTLVGGSLALAVVLSAARVDDAAVEGTDVAFAVAPPGAAASAVIAADDGASTVQLVATGLDPDVTYALWLSPPGGTLDDRVPAGTFRPDERGNVSVRLRCSLPPDRYDRAWATTPSGAVALDTRPGPAYRDED